MQSFVYFAQDPETALIKIGFSLCVPARLTDLQRLLRREVELLAVSPGALEEEVVFHEKFAHLRQQGEWFLPGDDLLSEVSALREEHDHYLSTPDALDIPADADLLTPKAVATLLRMSVSSVRRYADRPVEPSERGSVHRRVHQLRDPCIFQDEGRTYLLYSVAGEHGIAIAELTGP